MEIISVTENDAIQKVVSGYYDACSRDPAEVAAFCGEPTMVVLPNDVFTLGKRADVEGFLAKLLGGLKPLGYSFSKLGNWTIRVSKCWAQRRRYTARLPFAIGPMAQNFSGRDALTYFIKVNPAGRFME